jgi:hypothetical protein
MIRTFQPGDEAAQVSIYDEAAGHLPKFKPATIQEVQRRTRATDFDPSTRFYAQAGKDTVGYATFLTNGRVSNPWCRKGHESFTEPLFERVIEAMRARRIPTAFSAYRADWSDPQAFFLAHRFHKTRDMVNFVLPVVEMPTPAAGRLSSPAPLIPADIPAVLALVPGLLRITAPTALEKYLFHNPYFAPESLFTIRQPSSDALLGVAILIADATYTDPRVVDAGMPCFRLGAFGTEGMQLKRINGLFSFLAPAGDANRIGVDLLAHAAHRLQQTDGEALAAQVPSDFPHLLRFYQHHFRLQGSFPILERAL